MCFRFVVLFPGGIIPAPSLSTPCVYIVLELSGMVVAAKACRASHVTFDVA